MTKEIRIEVQVEDLIRTTPDGERLTVPLAAYLLGRAGFLLSVLTRAVEESPQRTALLTCLEKAVLLAANHMRPGHAPQLSDILAGVKRMPLLPREDSGDDGNTRNTASRPDSGLVRGWGRLVKGAFPDHPDLDRLVSLGVNLGRVQRIALGTSSDLDRTDGDSWAAVWVALIGRIAGGLPNVYRTAVPALAEAARLAPRLRAVSPGGFLLAMRSALPLPPVNLALQPGENRVRVRCGELIADIEAAVINGLLTIRDPGERVSISVPTQSASADAPPSTPTVGGVPPRPSRVNHLGIRMDTATRTVTRQGSDQAVEFGGQAQFWALLELLVRSGRGYSPRSKVVSVVWSDNLVEDSTVNGAISDLRRKIKPLGLTIKHAKAAGYRIEELPASAPPPAPTQPPRRSGGRGKRR